MPPARLLFTLATLTLLAGCSRSPDAPKAAEAFLNEIIDGDPAVAYQGAAFGLQALESERFFVMETKDIGLAGGRLADLKPLDNDGKVARFSVGAVNGTGDPIPLVLTMQWDRGAWRAFSLKTARDQRTGLVLNPFSGQGRTLAFEEGHNGPMPDDKEIRRLVRDSMNDFAQAVQKRDFSEFYQHVSNAWREKLTEPQLERAFKGFMDQEINLTGVVDQTPIFDTQPVISTEGKLVIDGHYPTTPYEVLFSFKFTFEKPEWKLFGVEVNLRQAGKKPAEMPAPAKPQ
jgi:hypothetical protein